jgi:hypothetical protein
MVSQHIRQMMCPHGTIAHSSSVRSSDLQQGHSMDDEGGGIVGSTGDEDVASLEFFCRSLLSS